ncbi:MAG: hypothetical protein MI810_09770 [Flavobacteriales bacterium]|jgi:hypothetical protein|nr:hypothetical protein [Flavobacteriales bacterium]
MKWGRVSLFKLPNQHRRFEYIPRYYDPRKESLKKKIQEAKGEGLVDEEGKYAREISFRAKVQDKWGNSEYRSKSMSSNVRLLLILGVMIVVVYYIFQALDFGGSAIDQLNK